MSIGTLTNRKASTFWFHLTSVIFSMCLILGCLLMWIKQTKILIPNRSVLWLDSTLYCYW